MRNGRERNCGVRIDAAFQSRKKSVISATMKPSKKTGLCRIVDFFVGKFLEATKERVDNNDIGIQTVNSGRNDKVETKSVDPAAPCATDGIQD